MGALNANGLFAHPHTHSERGTRVGEVPEHEIETNLDGIVAATVTQNSIVVITISGAYQKTQDFGGAAAGSSIRNVIVPSAIYAERGDRCDRPAERKGPRAVKKYIFLRASRSPVALHVAPHSKLFLYRCTDVYNAKGIAYEFTFLCFK